MMMLRCGHSEVMSHPVTALRTHETVGKVMDTLLTDTHEGYPIVDEDGAISDVSILTLHTRVGTIGV